MSTGDVMERALYNTVLAGMALDGRRFFYVNPLEVVPGISGEAATQRHDLPQRPQWYTCACCPPNVARLLTSIGSYAYTVGENTLFAHLYLEGAVDTGLGWVPLLRDRLPSPGGGALHLPRPGTAHHPGPPHPRVEPQDRPHRKRGAGGPCLPHQRRLRLSHRTFREGDKITLTLDMAPQWVTASAKVPAATGCAAVQRGPLVYCAEGVDNSDDVLGPLLPAGRRPQGRTFRPGAAGGASRPSPPRAGGRRTPAACTPTACPQREETEVPPHPLLRLGQPGVSPRCGSGCPWAEPIPCRKKRGRAKALPLLLPLRQAAPGGNALRLRPGRRRLPLPGEAGPAVPEGVPAGQPAGREQKREQTGEASPPPLLFAAAFPGKMEPPAAL